MKEGLPARKKMRLKGYDYASAGAYFVTICTKNRRNLLGEIVGCDVLIAPPAVRLSPYGIVADKHIGRINAMCDRISVLKYAIMPNHIHIVFQVQENATANEVPGAMRTSRPTSTSIPSIVRSFKTMVTKEIGVSIWQATYHDHIIRDEADYQRIWQYIDENPAGCDVPIPAPPPASPPTR